VASGDEWVQPLNEADLLRWLLPEKGKSWLLAIEGNDVGCAHVTGPTEHPCIWLWLDQALWNTADEFACLKNVFNNPE